MSHLRVCVLGAGIVGLSTAVRAIETVPGIEVTLLSDDFSPNTTGDGSAGLIMPYLLGDQLPSEVLSRWFNDSWKFFLDLFLMPDGIQYGIGMIPVNSFYNSLEDHPVHIKHLPGYRHMTPSELQLCPVPYRYGCSATALFVECQKFLPYLIERFQKQGGRISKRHVDHLSELEEFDVVMNCTGIGASKIVPDPSVIPIRGQVIRVSAPWIKFVITAGDRHIIPNGDCVILGGTHQKNDWNTEVSPEDSRQILEGCCRLMPSLKAAKILNEWVGLRPHRPCPRLERETLLNNKGQNLEVIHNYGHGGSGVTLAWGSAIDAVKLLKDAIDQHCSKQ